MKSAFTYVIVKGRGYVKSVVEDHFLHSEGLLSLSICFIGGSLSQVYEQMLRILIPFERMEMNKDKKYTHFHHTPIIANKNSLYILLFENMKKTKTEHRNNSVFLFPYAFLTVHESSVQLWEPNTVRSGSPHTGTCDPGRWRPSTVETLWLRKNHLQFYSSSAQTSGHMSSLWTKTKTGVSQRVMMKSSKVKWQFSVEKKTFLLPVSISVGGVGTGPVSGQREIIIRFFLSKS